MHPIVEFYLHEGIDDKGRSLKEIWNFNVHQLEEDHSYIQWLFPTQTPSKFNSNAPVLTSEVICEFTEYEEAGANLIVSSFIFQKFLKLEDEVPFWVKRQGGRDNHNCLRISRVIECLNSLEQYTRAESFYKAVLKAFIKNNPSPLYYWEHANFQFGQESSENLLAREVKYSLLGIKY